MATSDKARSKQEKTVSDINYDASFSFHTKITKFLLNTQHFVLEGINPGGIYQAIWCRDASYILKDWFLAGNINKVLQQLFLIWSHQIAPNNDEKLIYGRGSPQLKFSPEPVKEDTKREFDGALPTTIYQDGFSEVYGLNPDIDSTALMISTTSWLLATSLLKDRDKEQQQYLDGRSSLRPLIASEHSSDYISTLLLELGITDASRVAEFIIPRMLKAVNHLTRRDIDNDGLLVQNYNEDWMDTTLRAGKVVYSQACWILALNNFAALLSRKGNDNEARRLARLKDKATLAVEEKLWSEEFGSYIDTPAKRDLKDQYKILTQDVSLYMVAITQNTIRDSFSFFLEESLIPPQTQYSFDKSISTLNAIKNRLWKNEWPLVTEVELKATGPWILEPYHYHNHAFWAWTTAIELLARSRFDQIEDCKALLSALDEDEEIFLYEWVNPIDATGRGAYPFRTGIAAVRMAIMEILRKNKPP